MPSFRSFEAAGRKSNLTPFGLFKSGSDLSWIENNATTAPIVEDIAGTKDGVNTAFTISQAASIVLIHLNGVLLKEGTDYTISGVNITAIAPNIPEAGEPYVATIFA